MRKVCKDHICVDEVILKGIFKSLPDDENEHKTLRTHISKTLTTVCPP